MDRHAALPNLRRQLGLLHFPKLHLGPEHTHLEFVLHPVVVNLTAHFLSLQIHEFLFALAFTSGDSGGGGRLVRDPIGCFGDAALLGRYGHGRVEGPAA